MRHYIAIVIIFLLQINNISLTYVSAADDVRSDLVFWYTIHPGFPPVTEWKQGDTAKSMYTEMLYGNMNARAGSKEYFKIMKDIGFNAVVLNGFHGPYNPRYTKPVFPDSLKQELQQRNADYYVKWSQSVGLDVLLQDMFFSEGDAAKFNWFDDDEWRKIERHLRFIALTAKKLGCIGLSFDLEPYEKFSENNPWKLAHWTSAGRGRDEVLLKIYKRSQQMAKAIYEKFPEARIHFYDIGVGNKSVIQTTLDVKAENLVGDDYGDVTAYFLAGFASVPSMGKIHIDEATTYGVYDPAKINKLYRLAVVKYVDNVIIRWHDESYRSRIRIGLAMMAHVRTKSKKYWDMVKTLDEARFRDALTVSFKNAAYVWLYPGETDWIYPELANDFALIQTMLLAGTPYKTHTERMKALSSTLRQYMKSQDVKTIITR